jgi:3-oxosteroid 1-dehydrogenase
VDVAHDVVVLGSGGGGLVAALAAADAGAGVGVYEKGDRIGGTAAISGGSLWIPGNPQMAEAGRPDSREEALRYLDAISLGMIDPDFATLFVTEGPELIRWLERVSPLRFASVDGFPDYHPEKPGGRPSGGRTLDPLLFPFTELGEWAGKVVCTRNAPRARLVETPLGGGSGILDRATRDSRAARDLRGCGNALVGPLIKALLDRGVEPTVHARGRELVREGDRVVGVRVETPDGRRTVGARQAVVLATGGFEWDADLARQFLRGPMTAPASVPWNTGDGLRMAMRCGAALGDMSEAWWVPVLQVPGDTAFGSPRSLLVLRERTLPRSIMVNAAGRRFTDEAANYNALGGAFHALDPVEFRFVNLPCHLVFDQGFVDRYGFLGRPGRPVADWVARDRTLEGLAARIGVDGDALAHTVRRWNGMVEAGEDTDFHRGRSAYDRWCGDPELRGTVESTLGPLDQPPFYAAALHSGCLGTKGGPRTDLDGRVLDVDGAAIPGLFAVGNAAASPTGRSYAGAGGTLGPIMFMGRRAGQAAAR